MEYLVVFALIIVALFIYNAAYRAGKREGSRKGYGVGFDRGRRSRGNDGCPLTVLFFVAVAFLVTTAVGSVFAWW